MLFELGDCVATRGAVALMEANGVNPLELLGRHVIGDGGDLSEHDEAMNTSAILTGEGRVFSVYKLPSGDKLYVITESDRSSTMILRPEDY